MSTSNSTDAPLACPLSPWGLPHTGVTLTRAITVEAV